jgi:hypothetical protein
MAQPDPRAPLAHDRFAVDQFTDRGRLTGQINSEHSLCAERIRMHR